MNYSIKTYGQFLDQPLLVSKFNKAVPKIFVSGAIAVGGNEIRKADDESKKKTAINVISILGTTVI